MIEKVGKILDKDGTFGAFLTDLSKAFYCMTHDLRAKLHALNFDMNALNFDIWLSDRKETESKLTLVLAHIWIYLKASCKDEF